MRPLATVAALTADAAAVATSVASASPDAVRVVDRTIECSTGYHGGARVTFALAQTAYGPRWKWLPYADVGGRDILAYASIAAGSPAPSAGQTTAATTRSVAVDSRRCNVSNAEVALSSRGLRGGQASQFQHSDEYECSAPSRILIRLRAEFARPATFRAQPLYQARYYTTTTSAVAAKKAALAVTTMNGNPLVYATVVETGKATLFTAPNCIPD